MRKVLKIARWPADGTSIGVVYITYIGPIDRIPKGWVIVMRRVRA